MLYPSHLKMHGFARLNGGFDKGGEISIKSTLAAFPSPKLQKHMYTSQNNRLVLL